MQREVLRVASPVAAVEREEAVCEGQVEGEGDEEGN